MLKVQIRTQQQLPGPLEKSVTSALAGIAIEKGYITSVDTSAAEFIREWAEDERRNITIKDLLLMSSGLSEGGDDGSSMYIGVKNKSGQYIMPSTMFYSLLIEPLTLSAPGGWAPGIPGIIRMLTPK